MHSKKSPTIIGIPVPLHGVFICCITGPMCVVRGGNGGGGGEMMAGEGKRNGLAWKLNVHNVLYIYLDSVAVAAYTCILLICMYVCMYIRMCFCMYLCVYVCMYTYVCKYIHTHVCIR